MNATEAVEAWPGPQQDTGVSALIPIVRRIVHARVSNPAVADDLVQETLVKVLGAAHRVEPGMLEAYAIVTARNVVASMWKEQDRHRRNEHRVSASRCSSPARLRPGGPGRTSAAPSR